MDMLDTKRIYSYDQLANNQNFKLHDDVLKANGTSAGEMEVKKPMLNVTVKFADMFQLPTEPENNPVNEEQELQYTLSKSSIKKKSMSNKKIPEKEKEKVKTKLNLSDKKASEDVETSKEPITKDFEFGYAV